MAFKKQTTPSHSKAPRISINGQYLDQVRTRLHYSQGTNGVSYTLRPEEHHRVTPDDSGLTLRIPLITAVQLYHDGILPVDRAKAVEIAVDGVKLGSFHVSWLRKPAEAHQDHLGESVLVHFELASVSNLHEGAPVASSITPLKLHPKGMWNPNEEYWGEEGEPIEDWAKPIIARGPRPMFEMEQVLPGEDPEDFDSDPILQANALRSQGRTVQARKLLSELIKQDERCLDAYAHLGSMEFDKSASRALTLYQRGVVIGRVSLGENFNGVLHWRLIDNRPFLRCLHGYGLCLWRLRRFEDAQRVFEELLWLSPTDNQGIRFILPRVRARQTWTPE